VTDTSYSGVSAGYGYIDAEMIIYRDEENEETSTAKLSELEPFSAMYLAWSRSRAPLPE
jgi:hypothetical protein